MNLGIDIKIGCLEEAQKFFNTRGPTFKPGSMSVYVYPDYVCIYIVYYENSELHKSMVRSYDYADTIKLFRVAFGLDNDNYVHPKTPKTSEELKVYKQALIDTYCPPLQCANFVCEKKCGDECWPDKVILKELNFDFDRDDDGELPSFTSTYDLMGLWNK